MRGTVVISGASTGIGRATALHLRGLGFEVLAGVRREGDAPAGTTPVILDVTDQAAIDALAARVGDGPLAGLVNNAGIALGGPTEHLAVDEWRRQFDVNFFGHVAMTRALIPALRSGRGRIVNIGSIGGRMATPLLGPYAASKFALHGLSDALRFELRGQGIHVALIEPGSVATEIWRKGDEEFEEIGAQLSPEVRERYGKLLEAVGKVARQTAARAIPAERVAGVVEHALTARRPKAHYLVGADARGTAALAALPAAVTDRLLRLALRI
jgi:NAD(P)-dependent dehydrogenase (short-subunit alcohol dehydrogenase family)